MEKKCATNTVVKAEKHECRHGERKSADDNVIAGDIDREALDCPRCLHPLVPLVFQCTAGHVICSSSRNKCNSLNMLCLEEKRSSMAGSSSIVKMGPCGGGGGDAWEMDMDGLYHIVNLVVWYDNMVDAMMVLHKLDDGIKLWGCPQQANRSECAAGHVICSSCWNKCNSLNMLCLEEKRSRMAGSSSITRGVVKMGPCGGGGGDAWEMDMDGLYRIVKLVVWHDNMVDAMMVLHELMSVRSSQNHRLPSALWHIPGRASHLREEGRLTLTVCHDSTA
ncbi:hypothetical protein ACQ4PT_022554 [Festuca glaucescens]